MNFIHMRRAVAIVLAGVVLVGASGCSLLGAPRDDSGAITKAASVNVDSAKVGDCIKDVNEMADEVSKLDLVPCSEPHNGEVYAVVDDSRMTIDSVAQNYCIEQFADYVGHDWSLSDLEINYIQPNAQSKSKILTCMISFLDGTTETSSLKGSQK